MRISKETINQINHKNRGMTLENDINSSNDYRTCSIPKYNEK